MNCCENGKRLVLLLPVWIGQCPMAMNMWGLPLLLSGKTAGKVRVGYFYRRAVHGDVIFMKK